MPVRSLGLEKKLSLLKFDVLKYAAGICLVFWLPGFKKKNSQESSQERAGIS